MQPEKSLVEKYLNNDCTKEEAEIVLAWLQTSEGEEYLKSRMDEDLKNVEDNHKFLLEVPLDPDASLNKILRERLTTGKPELQRKKRLKLKRYTYAAAASMVFAIALVMVNWSGEGFIEHRTSFGQKKTVVMPDGSTVMLNGNSSVRFDENFSNAPGREVWIEGEGYFSVTHTKDNAPFTVHAKDGFDVMVLGTEFNLSARDQKTRVVLNSGKIQINLKEGGDTKKISMVPGELVEYSRSNTYFIKKTVNTENYSSWKDNRLIFDNTSMAEIAGLLKETFGLSVVVEDDKMLQQKLSGTIPNDDITKLLDGLALLLNAKVDQKDGLVVFTNN